MKLPYWRQRSGSWTFPQPWSWSIHAAYRIAKLRNGDSCRRCVLYDMDTPTPCWACRWEEWVVRQMRQQGGLTP